MESASFLSKFFWDRFGLAWAFYFLWLKHWPEAIAMAVMFFVMGSLTAWMIDLNVLSSKKIDAYFQQIWPLKRCLIRWFGYGTAGYFLYEHFLPGAAVSFSIAILGHIPPAWSEQAKAATQETGFWVRSGWLSFCESVDARRTEIVTTLRRRL
jgi:hypothetical protein